MWLWRRLREPRTHVSTKRLIIPATTSGSQPPSGIFMTLAARKACSISSNGTISAAAFHTGHFQQRHTTKNAIRLSITMVAVTDRP